MAWTKFTRGLAARLGTLEYDSGRRSLALPEGVTGRIYVQRVGPWVNVLIANTSPVAGDLIPLEQVPPEFQPTNSFQVQVKGGVLEVQYGGVIALRSPDGRYGAGTATFLARSRSIPTILPGVSA